MQHTTNYALTQWEPTDRILMQDFNSDNTRLEAALSALAEADNTEQDGPERGHPAGICRV